MTDLSELLSLAEAAAISGRQPVTLRRAASIGTLEARLIGSAWVTTRPAIAAYMARIAAREWESVPQRVKSPGGHPRRARRPG